MSEPTAKKEGTIKGGTWGVCWFCGEHTHSGTPGWPPPNGPSVVCPGCLPLAIKAIPEYRAAIEKAKP